MNHTIKPGVATGKEVQKNCPAKRDRNSKDGKKRSTYLL